MVSLLPRARCLSLLGLSPTFQQVKQIHAQMITTSLLRDPSFLSTLIDTYFSALPEGPAQARLLFRHSPSASASVSALNTIIRCSPPEDSFTLYTTFRRHTPTAAPDTFTYTFLLQACNRLNALQVGRQVHAQTLKTGLSSDLAVQTTTIHFYATCNDIVSARHLFDRMPHRTSATWNAMMRGTTAGGAVVLFRDMLLHDPARPTDRTAVLVLSACSQLGDLSLGSSVHAFICKAIVQDCIYIGTGLVDMYAKCGCLSSACQVFDRMIDRNVLTWSAMIAGLAFHGRGQAAVEMLDEMQRVAALPNAITFTSLLSACCHAGLVEEGLELFEMMKTKFAIEPRMQHYGCVVDLLGRAGRVEEAYDMVKRMPMEPDAIMWRALLGACNIHGCLEIGEEIGKRLLRLGETMVCQDLVALSNLYASGERWEDVSSLREEMTEMGVSNRTGSSSL